MMNGHVSLTSDAHNTQLVQTFGDLFRNKILTDVTLLCEDKVKIEAHKVVLCAGSNFFREFFTSSTRDHLTLYMRGIRRDQLMPLIQFLYCGETTVPNNKVKEILNIAKELEISTLDEEKLRRDMGHNFEDKIRQDLKILKQESHSIQEEEIEPLIETEFASMPELSCEFCRFVGFNEESFEKHKKFAHKEKATKDIFPSPDQKEQKTLLEITVDGNIQQNHQKYFEPNQILSSRGPRSSYWTYFKFTGTDLKGPSKMLHCMLCLDSDDVKLRKKDIYYTGGTTNLKTHLERFHQDVIKGSVNPIDI